MSASAAPDGISARVVPEQHSDRLQAGELCFVRLIGLLLGNLGERPDAPRAKHRWRLQCRSQPPLSAGRSRP